MTDLRNQAVSYLEEGHALLRAHGLYGASDDAHFFAIDRALENFKGKSAPGAAEISAALQALYEAKRLVTARSSIEGRRIILGDWFMSLAVGLALPLQNPRLTGLVSEELCRIGADANRLSRAASKKAFSATIDRFTEAFCTYSGADDDEADMRLHRSERHEKNTAYRMPSPGENKLLAALENGYFKTAAAEARTSLDRMEAWFTAKYVSGEANEMDGWIYGAIMSGGKRLRPMLVRLCAGLGADEGAKGPGSKTADEPYVLDIMSTFELIHSASLVHDDIVDRSPMRRSRATINAEKGDGYAAMCGFRMIADALELIGGDISDRLPEIIAAIPKQMCGGELHQLEIENKPELQSEAEYFHRISCKTAALIEGACVCGAILGGADDKAVRVLSDYGRALGLLFQLRDDLLDYSVPQKSTGRDAGISGKPVSQDMERGVYSLPLLYARKSLIDRNPAEAAKLDAVLRKHIKTPSDFCYLNETAENSGGILYTREAIDLYANAALSALALLPQGAWTEALALLVTVLADSAAAPKARYAENPKIVRLYRDRT